MTQPPTPATINPMLLHLLIILAATVSFNRAVFGTHSDTRIAGAFLLIFFTMTYTALATAS